MNVVSLFDGMSCGQQALKELNFKVKKYFASEIDDAAGIVTKRNFPGTVTLGNVVAVDADTLPKVDLFIGGSPCQGFSNLGGKLNFEHHESKLFFEYVRLYKALKAKNKKLKFLLENVKMKKEWEAVITEILEVEPLKLNANLVSAQNRPRLYWTNIEVKDAPVDRGIVVKDILVDDAADKYFLSGKRAEWWAVNGAKAVKKHFAALDPVKALCMTARQYANYYGNHVTDKGRIRQLTPVECERLQCLPDNFTKWAKDDSRYEMLGNGWNLEIIKHIFSYL